MTPSDAGNNRAADMLRRLMAALAPDLIARNIDEPILRTLREFDCPVRETLRHRELLTIVGRLVQQLHAKAPLGGRHLTNPQARDEAFQLLEQGYVPGGYLGALHDAIESPQEGLACVLLAVGDAFRSRCRDAYVHYVTIAEVDPLEWQLKVDMATTLLARCRPYLPGRLRRCTPAQLADHLVPLLRIAGQVES